MSFIRISPLTSREMVSPWCFIDFPWCLHSLTWNSQSRSQLTFLLLLCIITFSHKTFFPPRLIFPIMWIPLPFFFTFTYTLLSCKPFTSPNTFSNCFNFLLSLNTFTVFQFFSCPREPLKSSLFYKPFPRVGIFFFPIRLCICYLELITSVSRTERERTPIEWPSFSMGFARCSTLYVSFNSHSNQGIWIYLAWYTDGELGVWWISVTFTKSGRKQQSIDSKLSLFCTQTCVFCAQVSFPLGGSISFFHLIDGENSIMRIFILWDSCHIVGLLLGLILHLGVLE